MTVTYLVFLDFRGVKETKTVKDKLVTQINQEWSQYDKQRKLSSYSPAC